MQGYEALVKKVQQAEGEAREDAFGELIVQFDSAAHGWAYNLLGDVHAAEDVTQDAFITAYQKIDDLREPAAFPAWLKRIVLTYSHRRTRRKTPSLLPLEDELQPGAPMQTDPAVTHEDRELKEQVNQAVRSLPERERVVTELFYITGYSQQEIAERLALPLTTVKKRLQYAREHLRATMPPLNVLYHQRIDAEDTQLLRLLMLVYPDLLAVA